MSRNYCGSYLSLNQGGVANKKLSGEGTNPCVRCPDRCVCVFVEKLGVVYCLNREGVAEVTNSGAQRAAVISRCPCAGAVYVLYRIAHVRNACIYNARCIFIHVSYVDYLCLPDMIVDLCMCTRYVCRLMCDCWWCFRV